MIALLLGGALAATPEASLGLTYNWDDPFVRPVGLHASVGLALRPWISARFTGAWLPISGEASWKPLTTQLIEEPRVSPDLSYMTGLGAAEVQISPARGASGGWERALGLTAGVGFVHTADDLALQGGAGDPSFEATASELHPTGSYGLAGELWRGAWGARLRLERVYYVEWVASEVRERKTPTWIALEATWRAL